MSAFSFAACDAAALENSLALVGWRLQIQESKLDLRPFSESSGRPAVASSPPCRGASGGKGRITMAGIGLESSLEIVWHCPQLRLLAAEASGIPEMCRQLDQVSMWQTRLWGLVFTTGNLQGTISPIVQQ